MNIGMSPCMIKGPLFRLEVFEIGQLVKVCAQMGYAETSRRAWASSVRFRASSVATRASVHLDCPKCRFC